MKLKNSPLAYGVVARALHWWMALIMISLILLGIYMTAQPDGDAKWQLYDLHKSLGTLIFLLFLLRIVWRRVSPPPALPDSMKAHEKFAAHAGHILLYCAMAALPITGYLDSAFGGFHISVFGWFDIPLLFEKNEALFKLVVKAHQWTGYALALLVLAHAAAALKHHLINRDGVLLRMLKGE